MQPTEPKQPAQSIKPKRRIHLGLLIGVALVMLIVAFEGGARLWLAYGKNVPAGRPDSVILSYYPELRAPLMTKIGGRDGHFDVLILSGSAFFDYYGAPALQLQRALEAHGYQNVRVWNMGRPAHGTLDSLIKYRWLESKKFDWVIVYHGINDLRANNVSDKEFRADYSHMPWYAELGAVARQPRGIPENLLATPIFWDYLHYHERRLRGTRVELPWDQGPSEAAMAFGDKIKTVDSFHANLKEIAQIAKARHEYLSLVTYASWLDPRYTKEIFERDKKLRADVRAGVPGATTATLELAYASPSYADYAFPCEIWGKPANLVKGLAMHNEHTRMVARKSRIDLVDLAAALPDPKLPELEKGKYFIDICHLSPAGVDALVAAVAAAAPLPGGKKPPRPGTMIKPKNPTSVTTSTLHTAGAAKKKAGAKKSTKTARVKK